ncbi:MAG TPA: hypothetical protein VND45_10935 [Thermoanaerobaculia bacterium]|jgi:hypothetical protein|nr:hypothetical protein [Thermoanaerobaculia bacterium]
MIHRIPIFRIAAILMCIAIPFSAFAGNGVGRANGGGATMEWPTPAGAHEKVVLTVSFPNGDVITKEFNAGRPITLRVNDLGPDAPDGQYLYELRVVPTVSSDVTKKLERARAANDDAAARKIMREAGLSDNATSGTISLRNGAFVSTGGTESSASVADASSMRDENTTIPEPVAPSKGGKIAVNTQVIADDLVVQGSECVGIDCTATESFGFDTIRLKENNLRIKADDTSTSAGYPATDWQLTFNDSTSGGANKFAVEDQTAVTTPFTITGGAASNSIFVDSTGRVGFRTAAPVLDLHVSTGNTPALRLEQTNAGGFTAQTWDIGANEANFFVRDVTGGSRLPFRIRPGAPTSSIDIAASGNVGIGTASPQAGLHVVNNIRIDGTDSPGGMRAIGFGGTGVTTNPNVYSNGSYLVINAKNGANFLHLNYDSGSTSTTTLQALGGNVGVGTTTPLSKFHVSGGDIRVSGGSFIDDGTTLNVPDYVFEDSYKLMALPELEKFIRDNKHLPNVPSAAGVKAAGLNLSQMQMRLLEKVEELTLYTLDQHNTIAELKAQNDALAAKLEAINEQLAKQQ